MSGPYRGAGLTGLEARARRFAADLRAFAAEIRAAGGDVDDKLVAISCEVSADVIDDGLRHDWARAAVRGEW